MCSKSFDWQDNILLMSSFSLPLSSFYTYVHALRIENRNVGTAYAQAFLI